ncbi:MAG: site-specific integrase [Hyphomicrobiaceae bacterium]
MGKNVSKRRLNDASRHHRASGSEYSLYAPTSATGGGRKYLNQAERNRVLVAIGKLDDKARLFALTLVWTGARISEVLALKPRAFQIDQGLVAIETLKRRAWCVREVPVPPELVRALVDHFAMDDLQRDPDRCVQPLWKFSRVTGWRVIKNVMQDAGIAGPAASPKGLRHSFGVASLQAGVPITLVQRWLGHARLSTTAIYANVVGAEEFSFAEKFWRSSDASPVMRSARGPMVAGATILSGIG